MQHRLKSNQEQPKGYGKCDLKIFSLAIIRTFELCVGTVRHSGAWRHMEGARCPARGGGGTEQHGTQELADAGQDDNGSQAKRLGTQGGAKTVGHVILRCGRTINLFCDLTHQQHELIDGERCVTKGIIQIGRLRLSEEEAHAHMGTQDHLSPHRRQFEKSQHNQLEL